jgi:flagellar motor protein MotB
VEDKNRPIIVKRIKKVAGGHHGGSWKVALADFMTAMFAMFLVLWLGKRDEFAFYRAEGAPGTPDGQVFEPLPVPLAAGDAPASGMDDSERAPSGTARIDQQAAAPATSHQPRLRGNQSTSMRRGEVDDAVMDGACCGGLRDSAMAGSRGRAEHGDLGR